MAVNVQIVSADTIYYDIDFSSPEHRVGDPPTVGDSSSLISRIRFGEPIVSESFGALQDQPLVLNCAGNPGIFYYDQIQLDMDIESDFFYSSFDLIIQNLKGSENWFSIFYDNPNAAAIRFNNAGSFRFFGEPFVEYQENQPLHFEILMNGVTNQQSLFIDGYEVYTGYNYETDYLATIRFSLGLNNMSNIVDTSTYIAIDNIIVADYIVPEPCSLVLLGLGGLVLRRRKS